MYKYVQRRLRDIVERTYSILDVQKTWTCNKTQNVENGAQQSGCSRSKPIVVFRPAFSELCSSNQQKNGELWHAAEPKDAGSSGPKEKCHKGKAGHQYDSTWISALTWSSLLVGSWYATQLLCLHRRKLGWDTRCCYSKMFMTPSRAFHTNLIARLAFTAPFPRTEPLYETPKRQYPKFKRVEAPPSDQQDSVKNEDSGVFSSGNNSPQLYVFEDHEELHDLHKYIITDEGIDEVDFGVHEKVKVETVSDEKPKTKSSAVDEAVQDLLEVISEIEFQLGVKSINAGDYITAVSHLKLATSHHHAGATFNLGICAENGLGMKKNMSLAMNCYQAAVDLGHPQAMFNLGVFYAQGLGGLKKSRKAAKKLFETAAHLGVMEAQLALGIHPTPPVVASTTPHSILHKTESAMNLQQVQMKSVLVS